MPSSGDYFAAARDLMADGDPRKVTIDALCKRVGTTSGSFYHHFGSLDGFVAALAADWSDRAVEPRCTTPSPGSPTFRAPDASSTNDCSWSTTKPRPRCGPGPRTNTAMRRAVERVDEARFDSQPHHGRRPQPASSAPRRSTACAQISVLILIGTQAHDRRHRRQSERRRARLLRRAHRAPLIDDDPFARPSTELI